MFLSWIKCVFDALWGGRLVLKNKKARMFFPFLLPKQNHPRVELIVFFIGFLRRLYYGRKCSMCFFLQTKSSYTGAVAFLAVKKNSRRMIEHSCCLISLYKAKSLSWNGTWAETRPFPWRVGGDKVFLLVFSLCTFCAMRLATVLTLVPFQLRRFALYVRLSY